MKKSLLLLAAMTAAVFNANAQVQTGATSNDKVLSLDSIYYFYDADSVLDSKIYNVLDLQTMTARTTEYQSSGEEGAFRLDKDTVRYLDQAGNVTLMKVHTWDYKSMVLSDSVIYSYDGNKTIAEGHHYDVYEKTTSLDTAIWMTNAEGLDTLYVRYDYDSINGWELQYKEIFEYDAAGRTTRYSAFTTKDGQEGLVEVDREEYYYDENGVDTLSLVYSSYNVQQTLQLKKKYISTVNAAGKKDLMYQLHDRLYTGEFDTVFVDTFKYDAQNRLVTKMEYSPQNQRVDNKDIYTYDQFGEVFTFSSYSYDGESSLEHVWTEAYFWSEKETAIEEVAGDKLQVEAAKFIRNGKLYIRKGEAIYDAKGTRIE